jgi:hypothetical protein
MHHLKEVDMLSEKMDLLMKRHEDKAPDKKEVMQPVKSVQTLDTQEVNALSWMRT